MNSRIIPGNADGAEMNGQHTKGGIHGNSLDDRAAANFAYLYRRLIRLYANESGSVARAEAAQLLESLSFVLGLNASGPTVKEAALAELADSNPDELFRHKQIKIATRIDRALETWRLVCETMPPLRNISLRDTLASIGDIKSRYDTYFAAHEVPCDIQYQLSTPVDESLRGIDYIQAWLNQLLHETQYIAQFTPESCTKVLEQSCPDYKGLHVNLYDLLVRHESELEPNAEASHQAQQSKTKERLKPTNSARAPRPTPLP